MMFIAFAVAGALAVANPAFAQSTTATGSVGLLNLGAGVLACSNAPDKSCGSSKIIFRDYEKLSFISTSIYDYSVFKKNKQDLISGATKKRATHGFEVMSMVLAGVGALFFIARRRKVKLV